MSIRLKIWISQGGFIAALILFSTALLWSLHTFDRLMGETHATLDTIASAQDVLLSLDKAELAQRNFLIAGDPKSLATYKTAEKNLQSHIDGLQKHAKSAYATPKYDADTLSLIASSRLATLEEEIRLRRIPRHAPSEILINSSASEADVAQAHDAIENIIAAERSHSAALHLQIEAGRRNTLNFILYGSAAIILIAFALLVVTYRAVSRPLLALALGLDRISRNEIPETIAVPAGDELGLVAEAFNRLTHNLRAAGQTRRETEDELNRSNEELVIRNAEVTARTRSIDLLGRMAYRLPGCTDTTEFATVVERFVPRLFPGIPGALYVLSGSHTLLCGVAHWGEPKGCVPEFGPHDCWGLRRGQAHEIEDVSNDVVCNHVKRDAVQGYRCIPLVAQSETVGLLYLERTDDTVPWAIEEHDLRVLAETLALALVNLKLRETLHEQSIRDPLTGLFNRRYLEEALELEQARAERSKTALAAIMVDIDHFKRYNDDFGHDAGDLVLKCFADMMIHQVRAGDITSRFGGEEFVIVLPGATLERASACAEELRKAAEGLSVVHHGKSLGRITISLGVAVLPDSAATIRDLLEAADHALYAAKRGGRNRVEAAPPVMVQQQTALAS